MGRSRNRWSDAIGACRPAVAAPEAEAKHQSRAQQKPRSKRAQPGDRRETARAQYGKKDRRQCRSNATSACDSRGECRPRSQPSSTYRRGPVRATHVPHPIRMQLATCAALSAAMFCARSISVRIRSSSTRYTIVRPWRSVATYPHHLRQAKWLLMRLCGISRWATMSPTARGASSRFRRIRSRVGSPKPPHELGEELVPESLATRSERGGA